MFSHSQWLAISLLFAGLSGNLLAVDGVILIDQNRALAGGVTPGDAPGFPITITLPGAYRLSGNLSVPQGTDGIHLTASNITIDLNGFSITTPTNNALDSSASGITTPFESGTVASGIAIRNGVIEGFVLAINLSPSSNMVFDNLFLHWGRPLSEGTFSLGAFSLVRNVIAPDQILQLSCPSVVTASAFRTILAIDATCTLTGNAFLTPPTIVNP